MTASQWKENESLRTSYPEAKRARTDKKFRRLFFARLRYADKKLMEQLKATTIEQAIEVYARLNEIREKRHAIQSQYATAANKVVHLVTNIPSPLTKINGFTSHDATEHGCDVVTRGNNWKLKATSNPSFLHHVPGESKKKGNRWITVSRAVNDNYVRSVGFIESPSTLAICFHNTIKRIVIPEGMPYHWAKDYNGIKLVSTRSQADDYHPSMAELLRPDAVDCCVFQLDQTRSQRIALAAQRAAEEADMQGVYVCLLDSLRAGNCEQGTLSFARRHDLDPTRHYPATELLSQANGDEARVRLAIKAAVIRDRRETEAGVCYLDDHFQRR